MTLFNWDEFNLSLDIASIDEQHKKLFPLINKLYDITDSEDGVNDLKKIISDLEDYTVYHFSTEMEYLHQLDYPKIAEHKEQHKVFTSEIAKYKKLADENKLSPADIAAMFNYLTKWLTEHIDKKDREYARYIKSK